MWFSQCYMLLCPYVYGLQQYGHLNNSCPLCFLSSSVLLFRIENEENKSYCCFQLGKLHDHPFGQQELFIRFILCVFREHLSTYGRTSFPFGFKGGMCYSIVLLISWSLPFFLLCKDSVRSMFYVIKIMKKHLGVHFLSVE